MNTRVRTQSRCCGPDGSSPAHTTPHCAGSSLYIQYAGPRASSNAERDSVHPAHTTKREQRKSFQGRSSVIPEHHQIDIWKQFTKMRGRPHVLYFFFLRL
jgi:hypothetical protein